MITKNSNDNVRGLRFMGVMTITPEIATKMLEKNFVNRRLNKDRIATYAHDMKNGAWEKVSDGLSLQFDSDENLMNGQHRLNAIIQSGVSQNMFIFQSDISSSAMSVPFDTGMIRSLAMITRKSKDYVGMISFFSYKGTDYKKLTPAMISNFENSLTKEQMELLEKLSSRHTKGMSIPVRCAFFFAYVLGIKTREEMFELFYDCINKNTQNPQAMEIVLFTQESIGVIKGGDSFARNQLFAYTMGMIQELQSRKYKKAEYSAELFSKLHDWMKGRV